MTQLSAMSLPVTLSLLSIYIAEVHCTDLCVASLDTEEVLPFTVVSAVSLRCMNV